MKTGSLILEYMRKIAQFSVSLGGGFPDIELDKKR